MSVRASVVVALLATVGACNDSERRRPPVQGSGAKGGASAKGGDAGAGGVAGQTGAGASGAGAVGASGDEGDGGEPGRGGEPSGGVGAGAGNGGGFSVDPCPSDSAGEEPPALGSLCDPAGQWEEESALSLPGEGGEQLIAITPDELTVIWAAALGPAYLYFIADRASTEEAFESAEQLFDSDVLSVSPDGLTLVVASEDKARLFERSRGARAEPFGDATEGSFSALNADAAAQLQTFGSAILSPDALTLYYTAFSPEPDAYPIRVSARADVSDPWSAGQRLEACELKAYDYRVQFPTGVSADGQTVFYEDGARLRARAAYRRAADMAFSHFVDLGERLRPQPNLTCDRLYYSVAETPGVFFASAFRAPPR